MRIAIVLCMLLITSPVLAGTFIDDFEDGNLDGWEESYPWAARTTWSVENGELVGISIHDIGADTHLYLSDSSDWQDYDVSARVKVTESFTKNICGAGLLVRQMGRVNYLNFKILMHDQLIGPDVPKARYLWQDNNDWGVLHKEPLDLQFDVWYDLLLEVSGSHFVFYVDGEKLLDVESTLFDKGEVGVVLNGAEAYYDNFVVTGDGVPDTSTSVESNGKLATSWGALKH
ncbi:family 16 glycoside hydrolase [Candidatus Poribacteria bacterium]